jgi:GMP synthase (glutamine-hydrolysing)
VRVLSLTHGPSVPGGVFEEVVEAAGHELERWVVPLGGAPRVPESYDAVLVFGGSMHPDQDEQFGWLDHEARFLGGVLELGVPALGVCLGAQLVARAAGAAVRPAAAPEVGWFEIELTPAGLDDPVLGTLPRRTHAFQWHHYTYEVPQGAQELARSEAATQAFRLGRAWGIQFHAEATRAMIDDWLREDPDDVADPELLREQTRDRIATWNDQGRRLCEAFLAAAANEARRQTAPDSRSAR